MRALRVPCAQTGTFMSINPYQANDASSSPTTPAMPACGHRRPLWLGMIFGAIAPFIGLVAVLVVFVFTLGRTPHYLAVLGASLHEIMVSMVLAVLLCGPWIGLLRWRRRLRWLPVCCGAALIGGIMLMVRAKWTPEEGYLDILLMDLGWGLIFCFPVGGFFGLLSGIGFSAGAGIPLRSRR